MPSRSEVGEKKPKCKPCVDCGALVPEVSTRDQHRKNCPHWAPVKVRRRTAREA